MDERRKYPRHLTLKPARIVSGCGRKVFHCEVRDLSQGGARLHFPRPVILPGRMDLIVPAEGLRRRLRPVWRREGELGVAFA
jgi:hypothetical protein